LYEICFHFSEAAHTFTAESTVPFRNPNAPIAQIFMAYRVLKASAEVYMGDNPDTDDAELDCLFYSISARIEVEIMSIPSTSAADMAAKMIVFCEVRFPDAIDPAAPIWVEALNMTGCEA
jgi:hypothetical protein